MTKNKIIDVNQGDILTFKASDGHYRVIICVNTYKERSPFNFTCAGTTIDQASIPTIDDVINSEFYGIGNRKSEFCEYKDEYLNRIWLIHPEVKPYYLGVWGFLIWRKDFMKFRENFELIGNLECSDNLKINGSGSINASGMDCLNNIFTERIVELMNQFDQKRFKVKAILS